MPHKRKKKNNKKKGKKKTYKKATIPKAIREQCWIQVFGKEFGIDAGRRDDQTQITALFQQLEQVTE